MLEKLRAWLCRWLGRTNRAFYIGGSEVLPPPLSADEEGRQIAQLEAHSVAARDVLIEHNLRLVVFLARKFESSGVGTEDLISIGTIGLIKGINTFRADKKVKLATYASRCIENEILMYLRKISNQKTEVSLDEPLSSDWDGNELLLSDVLGTEPDCVMRPMEEDEDRSMLHQTLCRLPRREQMLIRMRFGIGLPEALTQKEVAEKMGISQSYISRLEKRIILRMRTEIAKLV